MDKLQIIRGSSKGKNFDLKEQTLTVGSAGNCDIVVQGELVSPEHAKLTAQPDGQWSLQSSSSSGTFVNRERVDNHVLIDGDIIQVGSDCLLRFDEDKKAARARLKKAGARSPGEPGESGRKPIVSPAILAGIGIYLAAMAALAVFFVNLDGGDDSLALNSAEAISVLQRTAAYLRSDELLEDYRTTDGARSAPSDARGDPAYDFHTLVRLRQSTPGAEAPSELVDRITKRIEEHLFRAWNSESQQNWLAAARIYATVMRENPDIRCPATQLASRRFAEIERQYLSE